MRVGAVFLRRPAVRPATFSTSSGAPVVSIYVQPRRRSPRRGEYLSILSGTMRRLKERTSSPSDGAGLTSSIVLGMTALFQMTMFEGGVIDAAPLHRGADLFPPLLEEWTAMEDYEPIDGLNLAEGFARFGSQDALSAIEQRLKQVLGSNDIDLLNSDTAAHVGHALTTLRERQHLLPLSFLERVVARCSYNGASGAVSMIAAHGTQTALDVLLEIHTGATISLKGAVMDSLETLAGRLGVRIRLTSKGRLESATILSSYKSKILLGSGTNLRVSGRHKAVPSNLDPKTPCGLLSFVLGQRTRANLHEKSRRCYIAEAREP